MPPLLRNLARGVAFAGLLLLAAEAALWPFMGGPPPGPQVTVGLGGRTRYLEIEGDTVVIGHRSRGEPREFPLRPSGPRVVFLGGSSVYQGRPAREHLFATLVGERLGVEAVNLGGPGLESADLVTITDDLAPVPHDAVVVYCGHNDYGNRYMRARMGTFSQSLGLRVRRVLEWSCLFRLIDRRFAGFDLHRHVGEAADVRLGPVERADVLRRFEANLRRIVATTIDRGAVPVLAVPASNVRHPPTCAACAGDLFARGMAEKDPVEAARLLVAARDANPESVRAPSELGERVRAVAFETGVAVVDVERDLPRDPELDVVDPRLFLDQVHFNEAGHAAVADLLVPAVEAALARPASTPWPAPPR